MAAAPEECHIETNVATEDVATTTVHVEDLVTGLTSHKGEKVRSYTMKFKLEALSYLETNTVRATARKYAVDRSTIKEWKKKQSSLKKQSMLSAGGNTRKRLNGGGRKPLSVSLEERLIKWIYDRRQKRLRVSRKLIMMTAKVLFDEMKTTNNQTIEKDLTFAASRGWVEKFMKRNGLSLRRHTSVAQKDPEQLLGKLVSYVLRVRKLQEQFKYLPSDIIAFDETPVWSDMVSNITVEKRGAKEVTLKSTGHEKSRVTVGLAAKGDGSKLKPMIVFKDAKRDVAALSKEFKGRCVIMSTSNAWMDTATTLAWCDTVIGSFSFRRRLLAWDTYECHLMPCVQKSLSSKKVDTALIPGGTTRYIQAPDVSWNKPFKSHCAEQYDSWLETTGILDTNLTDAGNLKPPSRRTLVQWILKAWDSLSTELIKKSFVSCGLTTMVDGSMDNEIHCFKPGQPCEKGRAMLAEQFKQFNEIEGNPFEPEKEDIDESAPTFLLIDEDEDEDEELEIDF